MVDRRRKRRAKNQNIFIRNSLGSNQYLVSGSRSHDYVVNLNGPSCECPDWQEERPEGGCKHIIYVKMNHNSGSRQSTSYSDSTTGQPASKNTASQSSTEYRSTRAEQGNDRSKTAAKSSQPATGQQNNSGSVSNTDSVARTESDESLSATSHQSNQTTQSEATESVDSLSEAIIGGFVLAILITILIEIMLTLLSISLGTLITRFAVVYFIIEALVVPGYFLDSESGRTASSKRTERSSSTVSPEKTATTTTDSPDENDSETTDSPDENDSETTDSPDETTPKSTHSKSTDNSNQLSDEAWRRKQDQGSPNRYRGPGRY